MKIGRPSLTIPSALPNLLTQSSYLNELSGHLTPATHSQLLSVATTLVFKAYSHINQKQSNQLLIVFGEALLLAPRKIKEVYDYQADRKEAELNYKYGGLKATEEDYFAKRLELMYADFQVARREAGDFVYGEVFQEAGEDEVLLARRECTVLAFNVLRISSTLRAQLETCYNDKLRFLGSFPCLSPFPKPLSSFKYMIYRYQQTILDPNLIYFLRSGELEFLNEGSRLYQISGEQVFEIEEGEVVKAVSQKVVVYGISKENYRKVLNQKELRHLSRLKLFKQGLKLQTKDYYKIAFKQHRNDGENQRYQSEVRRNFMKSQVLTNQYNIQLRTNGQRKRVILEKLNANGGKDNVLYEYKPIQRTLPDMTPVKQRCDIFKAQQYRLAKQIRENSVVAQYRSLVSAGLETPVKHSLQENSIRRQLAKLNEPQDNKQYNIWEILKKCR